MSFNMSNYMDGVPVKISEKYKPPPEVTIPQEVLNRIKTISEDQYQSDHYTYSFQLENQVIKKLDEWKKVREIELENRRERIQKYELQKLRDLEAKQKQLLTEVSYPSTDDLSSDEDEKETKNEEKEAKTNPTSELNNYHVLQNFDTILQPTVASSLSSSSTYTPSTVFIPSKINYSDFENDTSSPFDNIELKTINDLDILAQVLNDTQIHSGDKNLDERVKEEIVESEVSDSNLEPKSTPPTNVNNPPINCELINKNEEPPSTIINQNHASQFYYNTNVIPNNYQMMSHPTQVIHHQLHQQHQYMLNYGNYNHHTIKPSPADMYFNYTNLPEANNHNFLYTNYTHQPDLEVPISQSIKNQYPNETFINNGCDSQYGMQSVDVVSNSNRLETDSIPKSKSKSVPDILKELKDEIRDSKIRRTRNHSQTMDDQTKRNSADSEQSLPSPAPISSTSSSSSTTSFMKLSPSSQALAKNISSMGFPLERVSKIAELYGNDDKKIVEHLISLSELLDLGFDESKISEALIKFDNNKDKALDYLIS